MTTKSTVIVLGLVAVLSQLVPGGLAWDPEGEAKCRQLHDVEEVSAPYTYYRNKKCTLQCGIGGEFYFHKLNEGQTCTYGYVCRNGYCVEDIVMGHISVQINSASLPQAGNVYAQVCVQNSTFEGKHPIVDTSICVECYTKTVPKSANPQWNEGCHNLANHLFQEGSLVFIQLWDQQESLMEKYLGRAETTIGWVMVKGFNRKGHNYPLTGTKHIGTVNATISWKPLPIPKH